MLHMLSTYNFICQFRSNEKNQNGISPYRKRVRKQTVICTHCKVSLNHRDKWKSDTVTEQINMEEVVLSETTQIQKGEYCVSSSNHRVRE